MTAPTVQQFFETPLIAATLASPGPDAVAAAAVALAERYSFDVSQPAAPRFVWAVDTREVTLVPGEVLPMGTAPGLFWIAACCIDPGDGGGGLSIEDPRLATAAAGVLGLDVTDGLPVETVAPLAGELHLFQAFLRHGFANTGALPQRWVLASLRAKPA